MLSPLSSSQEAAPETVLTPRFYTTDFDEMEEIFSLEKNPNLNVSFEWKGRVEAETRRARTATEDGRGDRRLSSPPLCSLSLSRRSALTLPPLPLYLSPLR